MKRIAFALVLALGGCMAGTGISVNYPDTDSSPSAFETSSQQSSGPQLVIPATGGAPVLATPIGGDMYLPVTGGPAIIGTST
jgi:hypothetical protein